jgi:hypothetical protein
MKLGLILTNDWELFGNGSGDYFELQHQPLIKFLNLADDFGAKLTLMAEVGQQWAHQELANKELWALEIATAWESILKEAIFKGHDVQLHLHPQWLNAKYNNNKWILNYDQWAISSLPLETLEDVLKRGKYYLEEILKLVKPEYSCIAFRAGGYCMQPSKNVISALLKACIYSDTSVTKGMKISGFFDYRDAYSNILPWFVNFEDIRYKNKEENGLIEIPIYSCKKLDTPILRKFLSQKLGDLLSFGISVPDDEIHWQKNNELRSKVIYPESNRPLSSSHKNVISKLLGSPLNLFSAFIRKKWIQLDYDFLPPAIFVKMIEELWSKTTNNKETDIIPVVASGHVKNSQNEDNLKNILSQIELKMKEKVVYWTLADAVRYILKRTETKGD